MGNQLQESFKPVMKALDDYIEWMESLMTKKQIEESKRRSKRGEKE